MIDIESQDKLQEVFGIPDDIRDKVIDIYFYMKERECSKMEILFKNGDMMLQILKEEEK